MGYVVTSETCALDLIGATYEREIRAGEVLLFNARGMTSYTPVPAGAVGLSVFSSKSYFAPAG